MANKNHAITPIETKRASTELSSLGREKGEPMKIRAKGHMREYAKWTHGFVAMQTLMGPKAGYGELPCNRECMLQTSSQQDIEKCHKAPVTYGNYRFYAV